MILPGGKVISTKLALGIGGGVIAAAGVATAVILSINGQDSFRSITVLDSVGQVTITRDAEAMDPYKDMKLESGDDIQVGNASELDMVLDGDKTVYVEQNTHMWLEASGNPEDSTTVIYMDAGATMHKIDNKLSDDSTYQVDTPNSTMSIRGTLPRVVVEEKDGIFYTDYQVFEGDVEIQLKTTEGAPVGEPVSVPAGYEIKTRGDQDFSEVIIQKVDGVEVEMMPIDYSELPVAALEQLEEIAISGDKILSMGDQELKIEELQGIVEEAKAAEVDEQKAEASKDEVLVVEPVSILTPAVVPTEPEPIATPAITPRAKVLAEPTPTVIDASAITPAVTPTVAVQASTEEESSGESSSSSEESSSSTEDTSTYTVTYKNGGSTFATKTVTGPNPGSAPTFQPSASGSWGTPEVDSENKTITINWQ